jgi:hypothetical protein
LLIKITSANKNYMSIAVSVLTTSRVACNNGGAVRQETTKGSSAKVKTPAEDK